MDLIQEYTQDKIAYNFIQKEVEELSSSKRLTKRSKDRISDLERQLKSLETKISDREQSIELMLATSSNPATEISDHHSSRTGENITPIEFCENGEPQRIAGNELDTPHTMSHQRTANGDSTTSRRTEDNDHIAQRIQRTAVSQEVTLEELSQQRTAAVERNHGQASLGEFQRTAVNSQAARFSIPISPPPIYQHNEDFPTWCTKFNRYLKLTGITGESALWRLLNQVDDKTSRKLQLIVDRMSPDERENPDRFIPLLEQNIYTEAETKSLRGKITKLQQHQTESVENFAGRIRSMASKIWGSRITGSEGDQLCYSVLLGGVRRNDIRSEIIRDQTAKTFEEAVCVAISAENMFSLDDEQISVTPEDVLAIRQTQSNRPYVNGRTTPRDQSRPPNNLQNDRRPPQSDSRRCFNCNRIGHIARNCRLPRTRPYTPMSNSDSRPTLNSQGAGVAPGPNTESQERR
jgi:hypothetical protein